MKIFKKIIFLTIYFYKAIEWNASIFVKVRTTSSLILKVQIDDKSCFIWSIPAQLHPKADSENGHLTKGSCYRHYFDEINIPEFDFYNGYKCIDVH